MNQNIKIPVWGDGLFVAGLTAVVSFVLVLLDLKPYRMRSPDPWFLCLLGVVVLLLDWKDYILTNERIICRHFFIRYRSLDWTDISDAVFMNEWNDFGKIKKENVLLLTLKPCRPYDSRLYSIFSYRLNYPRKTLFIHLPKEQVNQIVQVFQERLEDGVFRDMRK